MIFCASTRAASIPFSCSARTRAASSRSRLAPSIASSSAFSRASTAAVIFREHQLAEDGEENQKDDERPEHEPARSAREGSPAGLILPELRRFAEAVRK